MNLKSLATLTCSMLAASAFAGTPAPSGKGAVTPAYVEPVLISYSNVSLGYNYTNADFVGFDVDGHGAGIGVEFSPVDHLYLALKGSWTDIDFGVDLDYWQGYAGIGGYIPLTSNIHFVTEVGASYANLSLADFDLGTDDWGVYVTPHFRAKWGAFETHIGATYNSNELVTSEYSAFAKVFFEVAPQVDLFAGASFGFNDDGEAFDDVWGAQAGVRFKF